jgi:hypothetical protein
MPRAKKPADNPSEIQWGGFIDIKLDADDKAKFKVFETDEWQWTYLEDVLADEIKLSLSYDSGNDVYLCTLTSVKHGPANMRLVLTSRADSWERAVMLAIFKHTALLEGDWGRFRPSTGRASEV